MHPSSSAPEPLAADPAPTRPAAPPSPAGPSRSAPCSPDRHTPHSAACIPARGAQLAAVTDSSSAEEVREDSGGAGNETDVEDEDGLGDESPITGEYAPMRDGEEEDAARIPHGGGAMYPFPSTDGDGALVAHLHYGSFFHHHHRRSRGSHAAPPSSAEVLLSSATSASSASSDGDDAPRPPKRMRLRSVDPTAPGQLQHPQLPRLRRIGALGISVHSDSDPDDPNVSGLDSADRRPERTGASTSDNTRATDLGISSDQLRKSHGAASPVGGGKRARKRRVVADATFRGVVDELAVQNRELRERLRRYEAEGVPAELKQDRLFEIRFFDGLPATKRLELEDYLTRYVQTYAESAFRSPLDVATALNLPAPRVETRPLAGPSNSGLEPASLSGTGSGIRLPPTGSPARPVPLSTSDDAAIVDPRLVSIAREIVEALEALFQSSLLRTARIRAPPQPPISLPPLDPTRMVPNISALSASNERYFANLLSHDFLSQGFVYLNLVLTMAQIHRFSVTVAFVQRAVRQFSQYLELSEDGGRIRWKGPRTTPGMQQLTDKQLGVDDVGDLVAFAKDKGKGKGKEVESVDGASTAPSRSTLASGSRDPSSKETVLSASSAESSSRDPSSSAGTLLADSLAPSSRTGQTSLPSSGRASVSKEPVVRPIRPTAAVLQPMQRLGANDAPDVQCASPEPGAPNAAAAGIEQPSAHALESVSSHADDGPHAGSARDASDALSAANLDAHNTGGVERAASHRTHPTSQAVASIDSAGEQDGIGALVFYGNGLFCSDLSKEEDGPVTPPVLPPPAVGLAIPLGENDPDLLSPVAEEAAEESLVDEPVKADVQLVDAVDDTGKASDGSVGESADSSLQRLRMSGMTPTFPADFFTVVVKTRHTTKRPAFEALPTPDSPAGGVAASASASRAPSFPFFPPDAKRPRLAHGASSEILSSKEIYHSPKVRVRQPPGVIGLESSSNSSAEGDDEGVRIAWSYGHLLTSSNLAKHSGGGGPRSTLEQPLPLYLPPTPSPPHDDYLLSLSAPSHSWAPKESGFHTSASDTASGLPGPAAPDPLPPPLATRRMAGGPVKRVIAGSGTTTQSSSADERPISLDDVVDVPHRARVMRP